MQWPRQLVYSRRQLMWPRCYALIGLTLLLGSTLYWSWLGANVQQSNADQLVNGFLFENSRTFSGAVFPSTHTQLLKWPVFALLRYFGFSPTAYVLFTVLFVIITVAAFSYLLYRIDKRPLYYGTTCLLLASILAHVPPQALGNLTTPLNMAMLTGRNIEYVLYIGTVIMCLKATRPKSWMFLGSALVLTLLVASDQLFLTLSLGGSLILLASAYLLNNRQFQVLASRWLAGSGGAWLTASLMQWTLNRFVTHIVPASHFYTTPTGAHLMTGLVGTLKALGLNFGITLQNNYSDILPTLVNLAIMLTLVWTTTPLVAKLLSSKSRTPAPVTGAFSLAIMLICSSMAALIIYLFTAQSYIGDARYLTIVLFTGFIVFATYLRGRQLSTPAALVIGGLGILAACLGLYSTTAHTNQWRLHNQLRSRNQAIAQALRTHHIEWLVGNYWRVFPVKAMSDGAGQKVVPLDNCTRPAQLLGSGAWRPDLRVHSFAYILTLHYMGVMAPACAKQMVILRFGHPTATVIISGSRQNPDEMLLFYDNGAAERSTIKP